MKFGKARSRMIVIAMVITLVGGYLPGVSNIAKPSISNAAEKLTEKNYEYHVKNDGTVSIDKYVGNAKNLYIPGTLGGKVVTEIGEGAFKENNKLQIVKMSDSIVKVGDFAFANCTNIDKLIFSSKLEYLGKYAFLICISLKDIKLPYSLKNIDEGCFAKCEGLSTITFESNGESYSMLECIGDSAFAECENLRMIALSDMYMGEGALKEIKDNAFYNCDNLSFATFPKALEIVGDEAFSGCSELDVFPNTVHLKKIGEKAFDCCTFTDDMKINAEVLGEKSFFGLKVDGKIIMGDDVKEIKSKAFEGGGCDEIDIGKNVSKFDEDAFYRTQAGAYKVDSGNKILSTDENKNLYDKDKTELISYRKVEDERDVDVDDEDEEVEYADIKVPDSVKTIGCGAFSNEVECSKITLPSGLQKIEKDAFRTALIEETLVIPDTVTTLEENAFSNMVKIKEITLGKGITKIPAGAFKSDDSIEKINGLENVTAIGSEAFDDCYGLKEIHLGKDFSEYDNKAFVNTNIQSFDVDDDNKKFCDYDNDLYSADKKELIAIHKLDDEEKDYTVKKGVEIVGPYAGWGLNVEGTIEISDGVKEIKDWAFYNSSACDEFKVPASVQSIGKYAIGYFVNFGQPATVESYYINTPYSSCAQKYADDNDLAHGDKKPKANEKEVTLKGNETFQFKVEGMQSSCLVFTSTDPTIASVDDKGVITGRKTGSTYVCAAEGSMYFICKVNVTSDGAKYVKSFDDSSYKQIAEKDIPAWEADYYGYNTDVSFAMRDNRAMHIYSTNDYVALKAYCPDGDAYVDRAINRFGKNYKRYKHIGELASMEVKRGSRLHTNTLVYSGISTLQSYIKGASSLRNMKNLVGKVRSFECFTSTTIKQSVSSSFKDEGSTSSLLYIYVPKDYSKGVYISPFSYYPGEKEFLLDVGYKYKVVDAGVKVVESKDYDGVVSYVPQRYMSLQLIDEEKEAPAKPTATPVPTVKPTPAAKKTSVTKNSITYKVSGKVAVVSKAKKSIKKAKILDKVKIGTKTYKVTKIASNAFKKCKKLKTIIWGKNIKSVGKNAFYKINPKAKFKVPAKYLPKAKKLLTKKTGFIKKTMKISI